MNTKLSQARALEGDNICTHPRKHKDPFTCTKEVVDIHKIVCWVLPEENGQIRREMEEMDQ